MEFIIGGMAAASAGFFTNPLEVIKHHMEMSKKSQFSTSMKKTNFLNAGFQVAKQDGWRSLQKGLSPALGAHLVSYGVKLGRQIFTLFYVYLNDIIFNIFRHTVIRCFQNSSVLQLHFF